MTSSYIAANNEIIHVLQPESFLCISFDNDEKEPDMIYLNTVDKMSDLFEKQQDLLLFDMHDNKLIKQIRQIRQILDERGYLEKMVSIKTEAASLICPELIKLVQFSNTVKEKTLLLFNTNAVEPTREIRSSADFIEQLTKRKLTASTFMIPFSRGSNPLIEAIVLYKRTSE
jgi:hypothetical protein